MTTDHGFYYEHKTAAPTLPLSGFSNTNTIYIWFQQ